MASLLILFVCAAALCAGAGYWALRAYRGGGPRPPRALPALGVCAAVAVGALGVYLVLGQPTLPDAPYAQRIAALKTRDVSTYTPDEQLAVLGQVMRQRPRDPMPHFFAGQIFFNEGRVEEAARAYDAALRRAPAMNEARLGLARALVALADGQVTPEARALFEEVSRTGNDPTPWVYLAMGAMQTGSEIERRRLWGEALRRMAPDDPRRAMAAQLSRGQTGP